MIEIGDFLFLGNTEKFFEFDLRYKITNKRSIDDWKFQS